MSRHSRGGLRTALVPASLLFVCSCIRTDFDAPVSSLQSTKEPKECSSRIQEIPYNECEDAQQLIPFGGHRLLGGMHQPGGDEKVRVATISSHQAPQATPMVQASWLVPFSALLCAN